MIRENFTSVWCRKSSMCGRATIIYITERVKKIVVIVTKILEYFLPLHTWDLALLTLTKWEFQSSLMEEELRSISYIVLSYWLKLQISIHLLWQSCSLRIAAHILCVMFCLKPYSPEVWGKLKMYSKVKKSFILEKEVPPELADKLELLIIYTLGLRK